MRMCYPLGFVLVLLILSNCVTALAVAYHIKRRGK